ncbi:Fe-S-containing hydro-lyase [Anaeropeptidivorans aminofermentans]|jgi:fumarate hydratase subunit beta|uniref:Fe-S-containing hydro-lyase n=1 Tax=Anaeropeptidivorans aminofermentans TaxID=2934315 RepID=UPI0020241AB4|nr:Fe-S-containing hydro-lyase [Anaeropeptidivorans aminofermentans]MBE6011739.1 Fe-S-containing hydro-lyase [Lachnospiraceae bacterium]
MNSEIILNTPFTDEMIKPLKAGDMAYITGYIYTGRDAAHKRMCEMLDKGEEMPFEFSGQVIYYAGPCPNKPGYVIGSVGPTTSGRMDAYSPRLIEKGLKVMIGKGFRDDKVIKAIKDHTGIYFAAIGGAAALMSKCVKSVEIIAFEDLGTEAIRKLYVEKLPVIVAVDSEGKSVY